MATFYTQVYPALDLFWSLNLSSECKYLKSLALYQGTDKADKALNKFKDLKLFYPPLHSMLFPSIPFQNF